jgi:8-oxo-dGTP pyrophosphatase MutT (NUDIX family)
MSGPRHSVSVAAAIVDEEGRFLVIRRRDNGRWELPGGVLELGESIPAGVVREVHEETGFLIKPERLSGVYKNMNLGVVNLVFGGSVIGGAATPSDETTEVAWWTADAVTSRMPPAYAVRLLDATRQDGPIIRAHDGVNLLDPEDTAPI